MTNSKYEYVKQFEQVQTLLPTTFIVVRLDGKGFHKFTKFYNFQKPNDIKALELMNECARIVMKSFSDVWFAYGQSDEYSFVLDKQSQLYNRRSDKISSVICSTFTSAYTILFQQFLGFPLVFPHLPIFDARCVLYPNSESLRDYLAWRQVDCHINNLYNTCFWKLVASGKSNQEAEQQLSQTNAGQKNELLFSQFNINYNNIEEIFKKGTVIITEKVQKQSLGKNENYILVEERKQIDKKSKKQRNQEKQPTKLKQAEGVLLQEVLTCE